MKVIRQELTYRDAEESMHRTRPYNCGSRCYQFLQNNPEKDTAADIVELRRLSKGAVSKAVESLIQKSLLERIPDTEDRRKIHLKLKPQVGPVTESIDEVRAEFINTILEGFTKEELEVYAGFRDRLFDNIKKAMEGSDKI